MSGRRTRRVQVVRIDGDQRTRRPDSLAVEEPLELRVAGTAYTTTMRTPGHDIELAHGLLASEGIIADVDDVATMRYCAGSVLDEDGHAANTYNVLDIALAPGIAVLAERRRTQLANSACGVCGTASLDLLRAQPGFDVSGDAAVVAPSTIAAMPDALRAAQAVFASTGGLHAAGLFSVEGVPLVVREDVGRHNAVDKVLGWAMLNGMRPASGTVLFVSGRTSFELAQKAVLAGVPVLAGVSAPSSLAVELAEEFGLTLVGFVREGRMNVYSRADRLG